ncbi:MAG: nucleotidyltransferase family protein [Myxococcota bacterium]
MTTGLQPALDPEVVEVIHEAATRHGVLSVRVFGSVARGEPSADSDLDLLVDFEPHRSLLDLVGFAQDLEDALGHPVDVVTEGSLSPYLRDRVLAEARPL